MRWTPRKKDRRVQEVPVVLDRRRRHFPEGDSPADRMERMAMALGDIAVDVGRMAAQLKEEADAERRAVEADGAAFGHA